MQTTEQLFEQASVWPMAVQLRGDRGGSREGRQSVRRGRVGGEPGDKEGILELEASTKLS